MLWNKLEEESRTTPLALSVGTMAGFVDVHGLSSTLTIACIDVCNSYR